MGFYDLSKEQRQEKVSQMNQAILEDLQNHRQDHLSVYAAAEDTYIRKNSYLILGKIYKETEHLRETVLTAIRQLLASENEKMRQTAVYACGEIGKQDLDKILKGLATGMSDEHHSVRNAVIGALKQICELVPE